MFENFFQPIAQANQSSFLKSVLSLELNESQLIVCLLVVALVVFAVVWYLDGIRRQFQKMILWFRHSNRRDASALADGDADQAFFQKFPELEQLPNVDNGSQQSELMETDEEGSYLESSGFLESGLRNEFERPEETVSEESDTVHHELIDELAESKRIERELRTELETALESLELQTAEVTRLDQELTTASDSLQGKLELKESELEKHNEQYASLQSKVDAYENESIELKKQASLASTLESQVSRLEQELADRTSELDKLKIESTEAQDAATSKTMSLEETQMRSEQLLKQLAESEQLEKEARTELDSANQSLESLTARLGQAEQELNRKDDAAESLMQEHAALKSDFEKLDQKLAATTDESKVLAESKQAIKFELQSEKDLLKQTQANFDQQVEELKTSLASSQAALEQNASEHAVATKSLQAKLDNGTQAIAESEAQHKEVCQQLESKLEQAESELVSLRDESRALKSKMADLAGNASNANALNEQLAKKTEELEVLDATRIEYENKLSQMDAHVAGLEKQAQGDELKLNQALDSLAKEQALSASLKKEVKDRSENNAELTLQLTKHSELEASFESLCFRHKEAEQSLAQTSTALEQEQQRHARLKEKTSQLQQQVEDAQRKLVAAGKDHEQELSLRVELEETNEKLVADLDRQSSEYSKLEAQLHEATQSGNKKLKSQAAKFVELEKRADSLQQQADEANRKLAASAKGHEQETTLRAQFEKTNEQLVADLDRKASEHSKLEVQLREAIQSSNELKAQAAKFVELEERADSLQRQSDEANRQLAASAKGYEQETALRAQLEKANKQLVADLDRKASEYSKLEVQLREATQSGSEQLKSEAVKYLELEKRVGEVQVAFDKEKSLRVELQLALDSKTTQIDELEQQVLSASDAVADHDKLLRKLKKYKSVHRKNKEYLEQISRVAARLKERASEYQAAVETLNNDLNTQRELTARLQGELDKSSDVPDQDQLNRLMQQQARNHVLSMKLQFEEGIKKKNQIIRKLESRIKAESVVG